MGERPDQPVLLAIEASQRSAGVAVRDAAGAVHVERLLEGKRHDDDLLAGIDRLFARVGLRPEALEAVGVSIGPGGFTGLRIAVSTTKMLAEALGAKVLAVPSALVAAESWSGPGPILCCLASKRESVWATRLERQDGDWRIVGAPGLIDAASIDLNGVETVLADSFLPEAIAAVISESHVSIVEPTLDPAACLEIAIRMLGANEVTDPDVLLPLYPRLPEAVTRWEAGRSGGGVR